MRCASRLLDAHTHTHTWSSSRDYISFRFNDLFAKMPWPGDSKMTIGSWCRCYLPPMSTTPRLNLHTISLTRYVKQGSCKYQFLKSFGTARQGNESRSTDCKADALNTTSSLLSLHQHCSIKRCKTRKPQCTNIIKQKVTVQSSKHLLY